MVVAAFVVFGGSVLMVRLLPTKPKVMWPPTAMSTPKSSLDLIGQCGNGDENEAAEGLGQCTVEPTAELRITPINDPALRRQCRNDVEISSLEATLDADALFAGPAF